jgi:hypothetical protein
LPERCRGITLNLLPSGEFTLVQDEFDIQDGMDVTLWMQPVGTPLKETVHQRYQ